MPDYEIEIGDARLKLQMQAQSERQFQTQFDATSYLSDVTKMSDQHYLLRLNGKTYDILTHHGDGARTIYVNGKSVSLSVLDARTRQLREVSQKRAGGKAAGDIKAPMPGLVLQIHVKEGDEVDANDSLLVIEAMKMENEIRAAAKGVVKKVSVQEGQAVDKGTLLIRIE